MEEKRIQLPVKDALAINNIHIQITILNAQMQEAITRALLPFKEEVVDCNLQFFDNVTGELVFEMQSTDQA